MRGRIGDMRAQLHGALHERFGERRDFGFLLTQRGMFSYTGITEPQVHRLRDEHGVYLIRSGRMCMSGLSGPMCSMWPTPSPTCWPEVRHEASDRYRPAATQAALLLGRQGQRQHAVHGPWSRARGRKHRHRQPAEQARLTFANLRRAVHAANGTLADVTQVLIYMTEVGDMPAIDAVYREFFDAPYPNRSSMGVAALVVPGMKIEIVAYAMLP
jgi:enamine deaminase RidA (YjgF/YER057c/UK114 family)